MHNIHILKTNECTIKQKKKPNKSQVKVKKNKQNQNQKPYKIRKNCLSHTCNWQLCASTSYYNKKLYMNE